MPEMPSEGMICMEPFKIGRYQIEAEIGRGGMGTVYRAHDFHFDRDVAIKVLPREFLHDPTFQARFHREAKIIGALEHVGIVPVYDFGEEDGQPYLVMRLMTGGSLEDKIHAGRIPLAEVSRIFARIAPALDEAHAKGIVHRDLKPSNILFDQHDEPYLNDFGIARLVHGSTLTSQYTTMGTPAYMSPEQGRGDRDVDGRSDIYSLGAILFEILSGHIPYEAETPTGQIVRHITDPIPNIMELCPDIPPDCQVVINRTMAKKKEDRYVNVTELAQALSLITQGKTLPSSPLNSAVDEVSKVPIQPTLQPIKAVLGVTPIEQDGQTQAPSLHAKRRIWERYPIGVWLTMGGFLILCLLAGFGWMVFPSVFLKPKPTPSFTPLQNIPTIQLTNTLTATPQPSASHTLMPITRTPTFSSTPSTSPTLKPSKTQTRTPEYTITPKPIPVAEVIVNLAYVFKGPGENYVSIESVVKGDILQVVGRNIDGTWLEVVLSDPNQTGWIDASMVDIKDVMALPMGKIPPTSTQIIKPNPTSTLTARKPTRAPTLKPTTQPLPSRTFTSAPLPSRTPTSAPVP
jgi:serine/threonine protein kinase